MSRYLVLVILNIPLVIAAITSTTVTYKLNRISKKKYVLRICFWVLLLVLLSLTEPIYNFLYSEGLTETEALSLFDVVLITASVLMFFLINKLNAKVSVIERRLQDLHQEVSIKLSKD